MKDYYSRKLPNGEYELEQVHANEVGKIAEKNICRFGPEGIGYILGFIHDIGKRSERFQEVLQGVTTKVNHAIAAGLLFSPEYREKLIDELNIDIYILKILTDVAVAHHSGLGISENDKMLPEDWNNEIYGCKYPFSSLKEMEEAVKYLEDSISKGKLPKLNLNFSNLDINNQFQLMFFERMLLSSLVDADFTAVAKLNDSDYLNDTEKQIDVDIAINNIKNIKKEESDNFLGNPIIRELRNDLFNEVSNVDILYKNGIYSLVAPLGAAKTLAAFLFALMACKKYGKERVFYTSQYISSLIDIETICDKTFGKENVVDRKSVV